MSKMENSLDLETTAKFEGKEIKFHKKGILYKRYDGYTVDELLLYSTLTSQQDCEDLILFLEVHKFCFNK